MARLKKGSAAAKAWGRKMQALRGKGKKAKKAAKGRKKGKRIMVGGIPYEPVKARKKRAAPKRGRRRGKAAALPFGYGY